VEPSLEASIDFVVSGRGFGPFEVLTHYIEPHVEQIEGDFKGFRELGRCLHLRGPSQSG
jgi:hypothetical protein